MLTFHPHGIHHGPQPAAVQRSKERGPGGYADEIATFDDASKDAQPSDGMLLVYLVELDDDDTAENSEPSSATQPR